MQLRLLQNLYKTSKEKSDFSIDDDIEEESDSHSSASRSPGKSPSPKKVKPSEIVPTGRLSQTLKRWDSETEEKTSPVTEDSGTKVKSPVSSVKKSDNETDNTDKKVISAV